MIELMLNGQPVGTDLPDPVPCEICGHPVWLASGGTVPNQHDQSRTVDPSVWEQGFPKPGQGWALDPHRCRHQPSPSDPEETP
jgi:hypothetical protein